MRLKTQMLALSDRTRVEIGFDFTTRDGKDVLAVLAYDNPHEALEDALAFVKTAGAAVQGTL